MLNGLSLFSGIGGIDLALEPWVLTTAYCENDRYAQSVLLSRQSRGQLPIAPIWDDITTLKAEHLPETDIIFGGFPCQDISVAGSGAGLGGERSGLFFELVRLIRELRPRFIFMENVPAITVRGLDRVLLELTALGFDCRWTIVSAAEVGAPHLRERWFLLAYSQSLRGREGELLSGQGGEEMADSHGRREALDHPLRGRHLSQEGKVFAGRHGSLNSGWWFAEPNVGRVADGVPVRVDRLRGLGNAVVPLQARIAFQRLIGIEGGGQPLAK